MHRQVPGARRIGTAPGSRKRLLAWRNLSLIPLFQRSMNKIIVRGGILLAMLSVLGGFQGYFGLQRAWDCSNPGVLGCKDKGSESNEVSPLPADPESAPTGPLAQPAPVGDGRYLEGHEYPWSRLLDDCMSAGRTRPECFASLPPDILEQFEAWEAENAAERRRQSQQQSRYPSFGVQTDDATPQD